MSLESIVNVSITRQTTAVSRAGFGTVLILGKNLNSANRIEYATSLSSVSALLCGGTAAEEYTAASKLFGQSPRPTRVAIGQTQGIKVLTDNAGTLTAGTVKSTINGTLVSTAFNTDKDTTLTAHAAAIQALGSVSTAVYSSGGHTITITPETGYVLGITTDLTLITGTMTWTLSATKGSEGFDDALDAIQLENDDWYGIVSVDHTESDVLDVAAWTETQRKVFGVSDDDTDIVDTTDAGDTTTLAAQLKALGYDRTFCMYNASADTAFPEAAVFGIFVTKDPGSYTVMFKSPSGITADSLTPTQEGNALDKNVLIFTEVGGVYILQEGKMCGGEFIDVIVFIDWFQARLTENIFTALVNNEKIPFTGGGIAAIEAEVRAQIQRGIDVGGFTSDPAPTITVPDVADISATDKANRLLSGIEFIATLAGAIHAVEINGTVTV